MIVLDASVVVELLLGGARGEPVLQRVLQEGGDLHAPDIVDLEVANAVRKLEARGVVDARRGREYLEIAEWLPVTRHPSRPFLGRIWQLRRHLTSYDSVYVALAEGLACPLLTFDAGIAAAPDLNVEVELL